MRTNKNLEVKSKGWKHIFFLCVLCGLIGCENHWMKEATAHMHRHNFEWRPDITLGVETIQTLACTTGCNTTRGTRAVMPSGGIFTYEGGIIRGGQPDADGKLVIPATIGGVPITIIAARAFENTGITSVEININGDIGASAFRNCTALTNVIIGSGITRITDSVFNGCTSLLEITIPVNVTNIGTNAFANTNLNKVIFNGETTISNDSFPDGASLREAYLLGGVGTYTRADGEWTRE